jgi:hypothetical protein
LGHPNNWIFGYSVIRVTRITKYSVIRVIRVTGITEYSVIRVTRRKPKKPNLAINLEVR